MTKYRTEEDTLGPVQIPADALWDHKQNGVETTSQLVSICH